MSSQAVRTRRHPSSSRVTSKGQVTIPVHIRRMLGLKPQDSVMFYVQDGRVEISREGVAERTAGIFKGRGPKLSIEEMKEAFEEGVAEEAMRRGNIKRPN